MHKDTITRDYMAAIDAKKRIKPRGARYKFYQANEFENSCILLLPREADMISKEDLEMMDEAISNFRLGNVSESIELSDFSLFHHAAISDLLLRQMPALILQRNRK